MSIRQQAIDKAIGERAELPFNRELDDIKASYLERREFGTAEPLEDLLKRYPQYRDELFDFVITAMEVENCERNKP